MKTPNLVPVTLICGAIGVLALSAQKSFKSKSDKKEREIRLEEAAEKFMQIAIDEIVIAEHPEADFATRKDLGWELRKKLDGNSAEVIVTLFRVKLGGKLGLIKKDESKRHQADLINVLTEALE